MYLLRAAISAIVFLHCLAEEAPEVETDLGKVRGTYKISYNGRKFAAFEGIPYAKPPLGSLRFEPPQKIAPWLGTWQATKLHTCMQFPLDNTALENIIGEEDCLYINIYTPRENPSPNDNLDIIFHIHGGGFQFGSGQEYTTPHFLMDREVIFVSMNYRLGILGFLSTGDSAAPGNYGMKDQVLALQWTQEHIGRFGGNKNSVTITGFSAGSAAVHFHYFSPLSKGLFHRGLSHSGTALNAFSHQEEIPARTKEFAEYFGCTNGSSTEYLVKCLKGRPAKQLYSHVLDVAKRGTLPRMIFAPTIEPKVKGAFITEEPYKLLKSGDINDLPWINSYTTEEGIFLAFAFGLMASIDFLEDVNELHRFVETFYIAPDDRKSEIAEKIKKYYYADGVTLSGIIKLLTDRFFIVDAIRASQMQAVVAKSPVYHMQYSYVSDISIMDKYIERRKELGTSHGDDIALLYASFENKKLSAEDENVKDILVELLVSYATTGVPHVEGVNWEPVSDSIELRYLHFHSPNDIAIERTSNFENREFWDSLNSKEHANISVEKDEL